MGYAFVRPYVGFTGPHSGGDRSGKEEAAAVMDAAPFPNSVNAASPIVIKDKVIEVERMNQISRTSTSKVSATTHYSEHLYRYHGGRMLTTTTKVYQQHSVDVRV